jgi:hypothetical protein
LAVVVVTLVLVQFWDLRDSWHLGDVVLRSSSTTGVSAGRRVKILMV